MIGLEQSFYKFVPSMHPDINVKCKNEESLSNLRGRFLSLTDTENKQLFIERYKPVNNSINFTLNSSKVLSKTKKVKYNNNIFNLNEFGLSFVDRELGTGYHCPNGIFISNFPSDIKKLRCTGEKFIDTISFHEHILNYFSIN